MTRLIDADKIPNYAIKYTIDGNENNSLQSTRIAFWEDIQKMPTVEERPKGNWIGDTDYESWQGYYEAYKCSICGYGLHWRDYTNYNFCPNCGADMQRRQTNEKDLQSNN